VKQRFQTTAAILAVTATYFCAGKFGLSLAFMHPSASAVWPPSGIALAALLLGGYRFAPAIFVGAFLVNITTQGSVATSLGIAAGNTLEGLLGAWAVGRFAGGAKFFRRAKNVLRFILLAAILSTTVAATCGLVSLTLGGLVEGHDNLAIWFTWWLGDMVGELIVAPLLVIWLTEPLPSLKPKRLLEAAGLLLTILFVGRIIFLGNIPTGLEYLAIPPLLWAAFRFGERGAITAAFLMSGIALVGTLGDRGPFVTPNPNDALLLLQAFMGTLTVTALVLASMVSEQQRSDQRLLIQDAVSRILAESPALRQATPQILGAIGETAGWDVGALWNAEGATRELACVAVWQSPSMGDSEFANLTRLHRFTPGTGLPGRVWSSGEEVWIPDVTRNDNFARSASATAAGLHAAFGFPIKLGGEILGVVEFFSREVQEPDDHFLQMASHIGEQLGQFIERKQAEESLRAKEAQVRLITDNAPVMLAQVGRDERYRFVNRAYAKRFGLTTEQIVGKSVMEILGEQAYYLIRPHLQRVQQGEAVEYEIEVPYERIGRRFVRVAHVPEKDTQGNVVGWVSAISDMTERKLAQDALQQAKDDLAKANEDLERRVEERTIELANANAALLREIAEEKRLQDQLRQAQKMETIGTLAGGIAHDFNNILNIIKGYVTLLADDRPGDHELVRIAKIVDETVERGASIVQQLLTIARRTESKFEPVKLNGLLEQLRDLLAGIFPKTIDIGLDLDATLPAVNADANQIDQVLLNICLNARDAMLNGGKLLLSTRTVSRIELCERFQEAKEEMYACISVSDTGPGIDETVKNRIFEPFFTTKQQSRGTGLGLSVAYGIVTNHEGFIEVASRPNDGSTFLIYLPLAKPEIFARDYTQPAGPETLGIPSGEGRTVLFVEDEAQQLELMRRFLESEGYRVLAVADGAAAVETFLKNKDDISAVVLDLGLPKLNGWEAFQKMKLADPGLQPIVATGYVPTEVESALAGGELSAIILKPYRLDEVREKIALAVANVERTPSPTDGSRLGRKEPG
jgi:PAS domain S-box-containing protein